MNIQKVTAPAKKFWNNNKGTIAVVAVGTTVLAVAIIKSNQSVVQSFLVENNLVEKFNEFYLGE